MKRMMSLALGLLMCVSLSAKDLFSIKKPYLGDFPSRTTMVVLPQDNYIINLLIKSAVEKEWYLSPYEFCGLEEFHQMKTDTSFYFLMKIDRVNARTETATLEFLTLVKGGPEAQEGIGSMNEIIALPLQSVEDLEGTVFPFLPTFLDIIQQHVLNLVGNTSGKLEQMRLRRGLSSYNSALRTAQNCEILFSERDFSFPVTAELVDSLYHGKARLVREEEKEEALSQRMENVLVALVVKPTAYYKGACSYQMLMSADTRKLYYYKKYRLTRKMKWGFRKSDIRKTSAPFRIEK